MWGVVSVNEMTVLQSFPIPRPTTNPYLIMLANALRADPELTVQNFSWRTALLSRFDVFHVHWPEIFVTGGRRDKRLVRQFLFLLVLLKLRIQRVPLVRTQHNVDLPEGLNRWEIWLLRLFERRTTLIIRLTEETPCTKPVATIPHGHYQEWFRDYPQVSPVPSRLGYVGLIRRYKGVETLLDAFSQTTAPQLGLSVSGNPSSTDLATALRGAASADTRIVVDLRFLDDVEFVTAISSAELMVFPYLAMHNSGGVLAALSLSRPVLVPDNVVNRQLAQEVGPGWVHLFQTPLSGARLLLALSAVQGMDTVTGPDLSRRGWEATAAQHKNAYQQALRLVRHDNREVKMP